MARLQTNCVHLSSIYRRKGILSIPISFLNSFNWRDSLFFVPTIRGLICDRCRGQTIRCCDCAGTAFDANYRCALRTNALNASNCIHFLSLLLSTSLEWLCLPRTCYRNLSLQIVRLFSTDKCLSAKHYLHFTICPSSDCIHLLSSISQRWAWRIQIT